MHITVICPQCQSRYQLDPSLRGKRMRCPNTICRTVFEVREEGDTAPPSKPDEAPASPVLKGNVGEVVPVLSAEVANVEHPFLQGQIPQEPLRPSAPEDDSFGDELGIPPDDEGSAALGSSQHDGPLEMEPGTWEAPPVRDESKVEAGGQGVPTAPAVPNLAVTTLPKPPAPDLMTGAPGEGPARPARRRPLALIILMLVVLGGSLAGGLYLVSGKGAVNEAERYKKALEAYQSQDFDEALGAFQKLLREFPSSKNRRQYDFLAEMSAVRAAVYAPRDDATERAGAMENVLKFLETYKNDPLLKEYHGDIWHTLQRLARELTALAEQKQDPGYLNMARRSWVEASKFTPPSGANVVDVDKTLRADFTRVDTLLAARAARLELLDSLRELKEQGSADAVREGRLLAKNAGLENDAEVTGLLEEVVQAHRAHVVFSAGTGGLAPRSVAIQDELPSFYVAPRIGKVYASPRHAPTRDLEVGSKPEPGVVLALARGVLYALTADRGEVLWVRRVGVDTTVLPLRVPASLFAPEMVLVLSSDSKSVAAVEAATGTQLWQRTLSGVCLGQPVLVDRHLLVPTLAGRVEELETTGGALQGFYDLGQPLVVGGVHQPGTTLVYFPADSFSVYVLDVAKRACAAILYTGHVSGSLRGLPLVWNEGMPPPGRAEPAHEAVGWLLLSLAAGGEGVALTPYALPIRQSDQKPANLQVKVRGATWSAPWHDGEKLALATDAGLLALYGIRQKGNRDPLLFPLLPEDYRLESADRARRTRALVVHADTDNYWVAAGGKLHRLQATFTAAAGPGLVARWPQPLDMGAPLHAGQVHVGADGGVRLILVTQEQGGPTCWVRAVDAELGQVLWQRQLGMVCQEQPVGARGPVLCSDARGVFLFDGGRFSPEKSWQPAESFLEATGRATQQWTFARDTGFVHLTWGPKADLRVNLIGSTGAGAPKTVPLPAPPQGTPALGSDFVLLPLANGIVARVPLGEGGLTNGPEWRGVGVDESQPGHIIAVGNNDFVMTDGGRSLVRLRWSDAKTWEKIGGTEMAHRITAAPAVIGNRVLVADASGTVTALEGERLLPGRRWSLGSALTAGPFVRAQGVGLVLGKNRLVWLDPSKDQPAWEYTFVAPIVGQPELVEGLLVVADLQGGILALNPSTGAPVGPGYRLKANEAPTAAPLAFGTGQVFMPLMDGTVMVLPLDKLR